jgi:DNA-binding transcriptional LysR family regulator
MDRIDAMAAFVAVADLRGFAPAARRLGLSRPAVTRLLAALEARLETRLLQRTTRSVALTDAGTRYLDRARRILSDVAEAEGVARADRSDPAGRFVVAAPQLFGRLHVAPVLSAFLARHPAVVGELVLADRLVNLVEEGVDVSVRIGHLSDSTLVVRRVGRTRAVVVGAPGYLRRRGIPRRPEDLARHDLVQFTGVSAAPEWRLARDGREIRVPLAARFSTNSNDAAIGHAERGGGLALVLSYQVADALRAGRLQVVLPGFQPAPVPIHLAYPTHRLLSAKVKAFGEQVTATCDWEFTGP